MDNESNIKVSIIVPLYNVEKYIERCAISLFEQTYPNIEYVFVNDASPDKSVDVLSQVTSRYPHRSRQLKIINHNKNRGVAVSRNTALGNCTGDFVCQIDPDDYVELDAIESLLNQQQQGDFDIVTGQMMMHTDRQDEVLQFPKYANKEEMVIDMMQPTIMHSLANRLIRRSLFEDYGIRAEDGVNCGEDCWMMTRLAYYAKSCGTIDQVVYHYDRTRDDSYTAHKVGRLNKNKIKDDIATTNLIINFFKDKEPIYYDEANRVALRYHNGVLMNAAKRGDSELFIEMRNQISSFDKKYWDAIGWNKGYLRLMSQNIHSCRLLGSAMNFYSRYFVATKC